MSSQSSEATTQRYDAQSQVSAGIFYIEQNPLIKVDQLGEIDEAEIAREPYLRRASPEFAYEVGGPILRVFLEIAYTDGYIYPNSLVRSQPSMFKEGAYPTPPHWHFDFIPGISPTSHNDFEEAVYSNRGLITCVFDTVKHPDDDATLFLAGDAVELDLAKRSESREYVPGKNFDPRTMSGEVYWWDPIVR